jgi:transposase
MASITFAWSHKICHAPRFKRPHYQPFLGLLPEDKLVLLAARTARLGSVDVQDPHPLRSKRNGVAVDDDSAHEETERVILRDASSARSLPAAHPRSTGPQACPSSHRSRRAARSGPRTRSQAHVIERMFGRLKGFPGIATRYDKLARNFLAGLCLTGAIE